MIFAKSFTGFSDDCISMKSDIENASECATMELQDWLDKEEETDSQGNAYDVTVLSTSTQLTVTGNFVSYVITVIVEETLKEKK